MKQTNDTDSKVKKEETPKKKSSALAAAAQGRSAMGSVKPSATRDVNGPSGTVNTGTNVSYEDRE